MCTVSVVIPSFNLADLLPEAIESVLRQTYQDLEIIVIDDGSTDDTESAIVRYRDKILYVKQENRGLPAARNCGIRAARGKYVAFLDADDLWLPEKLAEQVPLLDQQPDLGLVCSDFSVLTGSTLTPSYLQGCRHARSGRVFDAVIQENFILPSSSVVRRSCLEDVGLFDESLLTTEDRDLWLRISYRWKIAVLPHPLVTKRNRPGNITSDPARAIPYRLRLFQKALNFPDLPAPSCRLIRHELAKNYFDLGYHCYSGGRRKEARKNMLLAVRHDWTHGWAWACLVACYLPDPVLNLLRSARRSLP